MNDSNDATGPVFPDSEGLPRPIEDLWAKFLELIQVRGTVVDVTARGFSFVVTGEQQSREFLVTPSELRDLFLETDGEPENRVMPDWWFLDEFDYFIEWESGEPYDYRYVIIEGFGEFFPSQDGVEPIRLDPDFVPPERPPHPATSYKAPIWRRIFFRRKRNGWYAHVPPPRKR